MSIRYPTVGGGGGAKPPTFSNVEEVNANLEQLASIKCALDEMGYLCIVGNVKVITASIKPAAKLFLIPVGFRPVVEQAEFVGGRNEISTLSAAGDIIIKTNGEVITLSELNLKNIYLLGCIRVSAEH